MAPPPRLSLFTPVAIAIGAGLAAAPVAFGSTPTCPQTSPTTSQTSATLQQFAQQTNAGVVYDTSAAQLRLSKAGGEFKSSKLAITDTFNIAAAADFDKDGWTDIVVGSSADRFIRFYKNRTYENAAPDWTDPTKIRAPKFVRTKDIEAASAVSGDAGMVAGDFNNDGKPDFFYYKHETGSLLALQRIYLGKGDGTFNTPYNAVSSVDTLGYFNWSSTNSYVFDYNKDGWPDIVFGTKLSSATNTGAVVAMINGCATKWAVGTKCATNPTFTAQNIKTGIDFGDKGVNALTIGDFTGDGVADLVVGSPTYCGTANKPIRVYPGLSGGGFDTAYQGITTDGAATVMLGADFSLDGKLDLVYGTDNWNCNAGKGGNSFYLKSNATSTPFSAGNTQQLSSHQTEVAGNLYDFDLGVVLDYDHDPDATPDFLIADGNDSGTFFVFANRVITSYVTCGDVASGVLDLGSLASSEMVVTGARLTPTQTLPTGTSVNYYMSNEEPAAWQLAAKCVGSTTDYCASFPRPVGRYVRWKATMCSNSTRNQTPSIAGISIKFDYTPAREHYRAGVIVSDGISYVGAFRQPGDRGHFYAINAALDTKYWDAAAKLNARSDGSRKVYTATTDGATRLDFTTGNAGDSRLQATLGVGSTDQASAIVDWARDKRFGVAGNSSIPKSRLGAVETSTPSILTPPGLPIWYVHATSRDRQVVDQFLTEQARRPQMVLFGSKDGGLHAVRTIPTDINNPNNGEELWSFIPAKVAFGFAADRAADTATSYPDGSPTLVDVKINGVMKTVAVVNGGNGSKGVFALDVTSTVDPTTGAVTGPIPLWHTVPGGALAGQSQAKVAAARVRLSGAERFLAIIASGRAADNPTPPWEKGREVVALDIATGATVWQFTAKCPISSDVVIFETDDDAEPGEPLVDGFADRAVLADRCGYVYKLDLGATPSNGRLLGLGPIDTGVSDAAGNRIHALFSTRYTSGALADDRPIVGTLATRGDASGRIVVFFGTGGDEDYDVSKQNAFYAVYVDTGAIRSKILGDCAGGRCDKFYGGVVVTPDQVFMTRAKDPPVGTPSCDYGSAQLLALDVNDHAGSFQVSFSTALSSTTQSSLFGDAGALYLATLSGDIVRIGSPRATIAGGDSAAGHAPGGRGGAGTGVSGNVQGTGDPMSLLGWRQVF